MRVGLLGASRIAPNAIVAPARSIAGVTITAVAARSPDRARAFAARHGIAAVAASYDELVRRDDVDLVYCALPPFWRGAACAAALRAGKMLLVEKPFASSAGDAGELVHLAEAAGRPALEAFHYRFHSAFETALRIVRGGLLGRPLRASGRFDNRLPITPDDHRWSGVPGAGATMDLGCYVIHALRTLLDAEPTVERAEADLVNGVDAALRATLLFGEIAASVQWSLESGPINYVRIEGSEGTLTFEGFAAPQNGGRLILETVRGREERRAEGPTTYEAQLTHCRDVFDGAAVALTGGADAVANMRAIDACLDAAGCRFHWRLNGTAAEEKVRSTKEINA